MELGLALSWWPVRLMGTGQEWALIDMFGQTYTTQFPLSREELRALPDVFRMRDAASLVYRMGRYAEGLETDDLIVGRIHHSLWREEWLSNNRETLLQHALTWA